MHNQIYDMDKKMNFSESSVSSPSSQSSMSSSPSDYQSNNNSFPMQLQRYDTTSSTGGDFNNIAFNNLPTQNFNFTNLAQRTTSNGIANVAGAYTSELVILEEPTEKFRFRYKSEMHGTHGSLNGERSEKNKKTFPEVELKNFTGMGVIRCSLYQTNRERPTPHSHQLVVRKDDMDECDPHDVYVSPDRGYIARFENMGIIHTAKKNIFDALLAKKRQKIKFERACPELSQREEKTLRDEAEREAKVMNLNQVRLCFEAFRIVDGREWEKICEPIYSRPINNRKSALTGELKICRLSTAVGSAAGGEDLILLVEKVSKKNIQVRFYEMRDDDQVWEAFGIFTDADVHHQYAIVVRTPPYKNKDIDSNVNVFIELVRKSDDERSAPLEFRYKPRDIGLSRKRRHISYQSSSSSPVSSSELPEPVAKTIPLPHQHQIMHQPMQQPLHQALFQDNGAQTISQEFNKSAQLETLFNTTYNCEILSFMDKVNIDSDELKRITTQSLDINYFMAPDTGELVTDGEAPVNKRQNTLNVPTNPVKSSLQYQTTIKRLISAFYEKSLSTTDKSDKVRKIFDDYSAENENGDTLIHETIKQGQMNCAIKIFEIVSSLNLSDILSQTNNLGQTPLHVACVFDKPIFIRPLLGLNCDPNKQDNEGRTALHIAIADDLKPCLDSFVTYISTASDGKKLNVNLSNDNGFTPLHLAIRQNNVAFAQILLAKCNASAKVSSSRDGNNALHLSVQYQNKSMVKYLLDNSKVDVNARNLSGHSPVDLAKMLNGNVKKEILDLLLAKSSSPNHDSQLTIKDEPDDENDSSTEDEDDKSQNSEIEELNEQACLKRLLQNEKDRSRLADKLNVDNKWKKLGSELKLDYLLCLFTNAEGMLQYLAASSNLSAPSFLNALQLIDSEAASIATLLMKT